MEQRLLEAGNKRLAGDIMWEANSTEIDDLRNENNHLKQLYANLAMRADVFRKKAELVKVSKWAAYQI